MANNIGQKLWLKDKIGCSFYVAPPRQLNTYNKHQGVHISVFPTNVQNVVIEILWFTCYQESKHPLGGRSLVFENNHLFIDEWAIYFKRIEKSCTTDHLNERADTICSSTTHTKSRRRQETLKQTWVRPKKVSLKTKWEITKKKKYKYFC